MTRRTRRTRRRGGGGEEDERRTRQEEEATDIKSNNPHLAGGEKWWILHHVSLPEGFFPRFLDYFSSEICRKLIKTQKTPEKNTLVGGIPTPLKNMTSSVGMMKFPTEWKNKIRVPNHQAAVYMAEIHHRIRKKIQVCRVINQVDPLDGWLGGRLHFNVRCGTCQLWLLVQSPIYNQLVL